MIKIMEKKTVGIIAVVIAILGIVLGLYYFAYTDPGEEKAPAPAVSEKETAEPASEEALDEYEGKKPTGDADEIAAEIASQLETEEENFSAEEDESSASPIDQSGLDDFAQSYDEYEL